MKNNIAAVLLLISINSYTANAPIRIDYKHIRTELRSSFQKCDTANNTKLSEIFNLNPTADLKLILSLARYNHWLPPAEKAEFVALYALYFEKKIT